MDHFNVTVQRDGVLVATRRGLQVSKQKHHGLSFVNSSCPQQPRATGAAVATTSTSKSTLDATPATGPGKPQRWKFVTKDKREAPPRKPGGSSKAKTKAAAAAAAATTTTSAEACKRYNPSKPACSKGHQPQPLLQPLAPHDLPPTPPQTDEEAETLRNSLALFARTSSPGTEDVPKGLPSWTSFTLPLEPHEQRLFYTFFAVVPRKMYPYEDILTYNPARSREFYWAVIHDAAAMQCVLMCNAMFRSVLGGRTDSEELAYHMSKVCRIINRQLDEKPSKIPNITLECITTLALMSNFIGRYDHWHVHMMGLKQMVELNGTMQDMRAPLIAKIRKTDLRGATALGTTPYLPFTRVHGNASDGLPLAARQHVAAELQAVLGPARVSAVVAESITGFTTLVHAIHLAYDGIATVGPGGGGGGGGGVGQRPQRLVFDPSGFTEELHWAQYRLLCVPAPLGDASAAGFRRGDPPIDVSQLKTENYVLNHQVPLRRPVRPAPPPADAPATDTPYLEPVLRIACLLYLKELMPDFPRNLGGYAILLGLLRQHLLTVTALTTTNTTTKDLLPLLRPIMVWACLVGDLVSRVADENECRFGSDCYDRTVYATVLAHFTADLDGDGSLSALSDDDDLRLCRLLDLRRLRGSTWDDKREMARMLAAAGENTPSPPPPAPLGV